MRVRMYVNMYLYTVAQKLGDVTITVFGCSRELGFQGFIDPKSKGYLVHGFAPHVLPVNYM